MSDQLKAARIAAIATVLAAAISAIVGLVVWAFPNKEKSAQTEPITAGSYRPATVGTVPEDSRKDACILGPWLLTHLSYYSDVFGEGAMTKLSLSSGSRELRFASNGTAALRADFTVEGRPSVGKYSGRRISVHDLGTISSVYETVGNVLTSGAQSADINRLLSVDGQVLANVQLSESDFPARPYTYSCTDKTLTMASQDGKYQIEYRRAQ